MKRIAGAVLVVMCTTVSLLAQAPPADPKFVRIDEVYKEKAHTPALWEDAVVLLPRHFKLDRSYQQASLVCAGGGAQCSATASGVPRGIHIAVTGGHYWSLRGNPTLLPAEVDDDDHVTRYKLILPLYCGPGGNGEGCNIRVTVWAKRK
jgi:hypothetical protein